LYVSGRAASIGDGIARAREVLASGAARAKLDHFAETTRRIAAR
jgi:anthranilate phosphoribosyltransferase